MDDRSQAFRHALDRHEAYRAGFDPTRDSAAMLDRYREFVSVLGSANLSDALPSPELITIGERWVRGEVDADDLAAAAKQAAWGLPLTARP